MKLYAPSNPMILSGFPEVAENKIVFCDQYNYLFGEKENASGNVFVYDLISKTENLCEIFANKTYLYDNYLYYFRGKVLVRTDLDTNLSEELYTISEDKLGGFSSGGDGYVIFWDSNDDYTDVTIYSYDICNSKCSIVAKTNYLTSPFHTFKIKNGFFSYAEKQNEKFLIHGVSLKDIKNDIIIELNIEPAQMVYNGDVFVWSDYKGIHLERNKKIISIGSGTSDVDIFKNRYVFYFEDFQIFIYDLIDNKTVFSSSQYENVEFCEWFDLDEDNNKAAFIAWDRETSRSIYPDWEYEEYPELIYIMEIDKD